MYFLIENCDFPIENNENRDIQASYVSLPEGLIILIPSPGGFDSYKQNTEACI